MKPMSRVSFKHSLLAAFAIAGLGLGWSATMTLGNTSDDSAVEHAVALRYPPPFCCYMTLEFGPMWCHTMQEEVVHRIFDGWCERVGWKQQDG